VLDAVLGLPGPGAGGITARSSERLAGDVRTRARSAVDGDPATAWSTPFVGVTGQWVEVDLPQTVTFDRLALRVVADGRHSVPTRLRIDAGGQSRAVDVPAVEDRPGEYATVAAPVTFAPLAGDRIRVTVESVRPTTTLDYHSLTQIAMPAALAELGIPGVEAPSAPAALPDDCRAGLLTVDGDPIGVRVTGDRATAERHGALSLEQCDPSGAALAPLGLGRGEHELVSAPGRETGLDLDQLVLGSEPGGGPLALGPEGAVPRSLPTPEGAGQSAGAAAGAPRVRVIDEGRTSMKLRARGTGEPFWLVLGQSDNAGWRATVGGHDLGESQLVDGYANGWLVPGDVARGDLEITLTWTPQRVVWLAIGISGLAMLGCAVLALRGRRRPDAHGPDETGAAEPTLASPLVARGARPGPIALVAAPLGIALVAGILVSPWAGLLVGALVLGALVRPRLRVLLTLGAPLALGLAALYIVTKNYVNKYPPLFEWPTFFDSVHVLGWLAIVFVAADALVEVLRERRRYHGAATPTGEP
jgi:arabinofuranan 3-O-arabinosyltransferase